MLAFFGRAATAKAERAGYGAVKNSAYTSFTAAKLLMSARSTVTLTTLDIDSPASARMFLMLVSDWRASAWIPPSAKLPVDGSIGS